MEESPATQSLRNRALNYFNIRGGEVEPTIWLSLQLMLGIASVICLKATSDSIFLSRFDAERLPWVDLTVTASVGVVVGFYIRLSGRLSLGRLIGFSQLFLASNLLLFWFLLRLNLRGVPALLYVWVGIFAVLIPSQVWSMAATVFDTRQAKRLFSLIGSGGIIGAALGGNFASIAGPLIGTENVLLATACFVLGCAAIVFRLSVFRSASPASGGHNPVKASIRDTFRRVTKSRYLSLMTLALFLSTVAGTIVKYQFKAIAQLHYEGQQDALTSFFGDFYGYVAVASFLFHMLATGRLLRWLGLGLTLLILPSSLLLGATALLFSTSLAAGILARGADQAFRHSLDRASIELLYVPISARIRPQVKSFLDMIAARSADGVASVVLLLLVSWAQLPIAGVSSVNFAFIGLWLLAVLGLRQEYVRTLRSSIERKDISAENLLRQLADSAPQPALEMTLQSSDQRAIETAVDWMQFGGASAGTAQLAALLTHESSAIRRKTMAVVAANAIPGCEKETLRFLELEDDVDARWQALGYLEKDGGEGALGGMEPLLDNPDQRLAATAAAWLLHHPDFTNGRAATVFRSYLDAAQDAPSRTAAARLVGLAPPMPELRERLAVFLRDDDPAIVRAALRSAGSLQLETEVPLMMRMLTNRELRSAARHSLAAYGDAILTTLGSALEDDSLHPAVKGQIPRLMSSIGSPKSAQLLLRALGHPNREIRQEVLRSLVRIRRLRPEIVFDAETVSARVGEELRRYYEEAVLLEAVPAQNAMPGASFLRRALQERLNRGLNAVFQLLALIYPEREILDAHHWITSGRADLRSNALEFLDSRLAHPIRERVLPAVEDRDRTRVAAAAEELFGLRRVSYANVLPQLLDMPDRWLRSYATYVAGEERRVDLRARLEKLAADSDPLVAETAVLAHQWLEKHGGADNSPPGARP